MGDELLIVGIGASAGGLDAFSELLSHLPQDTGMAFVLVQHLAPDSESWLRELLGRTTSMTVETAMDGAVVQPNQVYVIPPNVKMTIEAGKLHLSPLDPHRSRLKTIDAFFQSLAADQKNKAIAVVLSGSNNDGSAGIQAVRQEGGIVFAQDRETAEFPDMPAAVIATGQADFVLPPAGIAEELIKISRHPYLRTPLPADAIDETDAPINVQDNLTAIFRLLQRQMGVDFTHYKPSTVRRRMQRRMALNQCLDLNEYVQYLRSHPSEIQALYQDVLITVTSFFRDAEVFQVLQDRVLPTLLQQPSAETAIRIWVPGCSTGEEAYSLAMCLMEDLQSLSITPTIQVFGTDISDQAIEIARVGFYRPNQMEGVSPERCQRFFDQVDGGYQIKKSVREQCIFARQDLSADPPFSDIDLLSCRNVLIYFQPPLQQRVLSLFHYSLKPTGFLILGNAESLGDTSDLFEAFDARAKIYTRQAVPSRLNFDFITAYYPRELGSQTQSSFSNPLNPSNLHHWADQLVLSRYGPAGVIINEQLEILQFRGDTSPYLRIPAGEPSYNLLKMIRPSLLIDLRRTLESAREQGVTTKSQGLSPPGDSNTQLSVEIIPFHVSNTQENCYLILFEQEQEFPIPEDFPRSEATDTEALTSRDPDIEQLSQSLAATRQELLDVQTMLQFTIEEKESTNQQLIAANEEILSSNEELKSTNEELQTAKEEIQSANEELKTTNEELQNRNSEARRAHDDLINLINHVNIPILMLSNDLRIRRFTPAAEGIFNLISTDVGRPIGNLRSDIVDIDLENLVTRVIETLEVVEQEVHDHNDHWYLLRIRPYRTTDNQIQGAVVALVDIDRLKQTEQNLRYTQEQLEAELNYVNQVQTLSVQLFSSLDVERALEEVLEATMALLGTTMGTIQLYDAQRAVLEMATHRGFGRGFLDHFQIVEMDNDTACSRAIQQGQRVIIEDVRVEADFIPHLAITEASGFRALQSTPLVDFQGALLGVLSTYFPEPHQPSDRELRMVDLYGRLLSALIYLHRVEQDKQALAQREQQVLREQAEAAQAANASKDEFLAMLSHELRTPLTSLLTWIQLLETGTLDEAEQQRAIAAIRASTATQIELIEDLLDVSRIVQSRFQIAPEPSELSDLLQQVIDQLRPQMTEKGLELETDLPASSEVIWGDPTRLRQAFSNVLSNAIKFTPSGGRITVRLMTDAPTQVQVQISDTGQGIAPEFLAKIFERFRQADASNTRQQGGLGLGLFLVRSIVEAHGGTIEVDSDGIGQGTTFTITLPKRQAEVSQSPSPTTPPTEISLAGLRILLVEDDGLTVRAMVFALNRFGASVTNVSSASEALEALAQQPFDLILSDVGLPEVNGYDLMRQIRALPPQQGGTLPAIALTGYADQQSVAAALEAGFQAHLSKPASIEDLLALISSLRPA